MWMTTVHLSSKRATTVHQNSSTIALREIHHCPLEVPKPYTIGPRVHRTPSLGPRISFGMALTATKLIKIKKAIHQLSNLKSIFYKKKPENTKPN
jgi:hypothetical protein